MCSESQIATIQPRAGLSDELIEEVNGTREGLMALRQNVVLLRDAEDPERFYPVSLVAASLL